MVSFTEDNFDLSVVVDIEALREICRRFCELFGIGIKVFDVHDKRLADVRASASDHCGYLFSVNPTQHLCTNLVAQIRTLKLDNKPQTVQVDCFSGLQYKILPIVYDGTLLGRAIFGPYRPPEISESPATLAEYESQGLDLNKLNGFLTNIPAASDDAVECILVTIRQILDTIIHNSFKVHLTSQMHIASIKAAFGDLERTNQALKSANERLQELDRLKSNFIATVSHELRTPLTSVIGYSEMLLEGLAGELSSEQRDYVSTILEKGESLLGLIGQVLDLARIESGNVVLHKELYEPSEIVRLCLSDIMPQARKNNIEVITNIATDVSSIRVDVDKIRRVLTNLLGNSVKFTPENGHIEIRAEITEELPAGSDRYDLFEPERNRYLNFSVIDNGIGIPPDKLERIFDAFFQVDSSSTREFGGTGLGLAIVRNFVIAHGGRVEVKSELNQGSTFIVKLPYNTDKPIQAADVDGLGPKEQQRL
ncbi:MAG: PocR ligand-binding domain-containing protein [Deltaproteobacteria bacterium]|nr:PocR ligand-binding domain-containing protein [Deltaproteobacteria bacterium]